MSIRDPDKFELQIQRTLAEKSTVFVRYWHLADMLLHRDCPHLTESGHPDYFSLHYL